MIMNFWSSVVLYVRVTRHMVILLEIHNGWIDMLNIKHINRTFDLCLVYQCLFATNICSLPIDATQRRFTSSVPVAQNRETITFSMLINLNNNLFINLHEKSRQRSPTKSEAWALKKEQCNLNASNKNKCWCPSFSYIIIGNASEK